MTTRLNSLGQPIGIALENWSAPTVPTINQLTGNMVSLERLQSRHATSLFQSFAASDAEHNWTYLPYGPFETETAFLDWFMPFTSSKDPSMFAIVDKQDNSVVGVASYLRITPAAGSIEVGHIHFSKSLQKTRAATEVMFLMADHVFELGYRRYEWKCDALNESSKKAALRFGFTFEGVFRQATVYKNRNRDTAWFALLDSDWPDVRKAYLQWLSSDNFDSQGQQIKSLSQLQPTYGQ